ncbi:MAG TPA: hypothetical protein VFB72_07880, partial [Verrucomicrobiae bacterium]|nr:hypothetical protein [Verrucomicrobiae bacterium]
LIPTISLDAGASKSLKSIPTMSLHDVTFNIDSFFNVPGVVNFHARLFSGRLSVMRAEAALQMAEREQTIELYKLFLEAREYDEEAMELKKERAVAEAMRKADEISGQVLLKDVMNEEALLQKSREDFQARTGNLLGERRFRWVLTMDSFPEFDYAEHPLPLMDTNRVAQLQMKIVALELVGDWAQLHGIKLQYWPELTFYVTGPSMFQFADNRGSFIGPGNMVGAVDTFWTLDTRGYISQQLRTVRRAQDLEKAQMQLTALDLIDRLLSARKTEASLQEQSSQLDKLLAFLDKVPPDTDISSILQRAETNRSFRFQRAHLRRELAAMNTLFWFVDDQKWGHPKELCMQR